MQVPPKWITYLERPQAFSLGDYVKTFYQNEDGSRSGATACGTIICSSISGEVSDADAGCVLVAFDSGLKQWLPPGWITLLEHPRAYLPGDCVKSHLKGKDGLKSRESSLGTVVAKLMKGEPSTENVGCIQVLFDSGMKQWVRSFGSLRRIHSSSSFTTAAPRRFVSSFHLCIMTW